MHIGQKFEKLTVCVFVSERVVGLFCDCGQPTKASISKLEVGDKKSCGCLWLQNRNNLNDYCKRHNLSKTRTYAKWCGMKRRCYNKNEMNYPRYGGKGVKVCDRWLNSFENFLEDMGEAPKGLTLDRISPNGDYEPTNCRWATIDEQARNKKNVEKIMIGDESKCLAEWARYYGVGYDRLRHLYKRRKLNILDAISKSK